jgi:hypothetical protein
MFLSNKADLQYQAWDVGSVHLDSPVAASKGAPALAHKQTELYQYHNVTVRLPLSVACNIEKNNSTESFKC